MTIDDLRSAGEALYGSRWQGELSRALGINRRLIVFWVCGERRLPADLGERIDAVIAAKIASLAEARRKLRQTTRRAA